MFLPHGACRTALTHRSGNMRIRRGWPPRRTLISRTTRCSERTSTHSTNGSSFRAAGGSGLRDGPARDPVCPPRVLGHRRRPVAADARGGRLQGRGPRDRAGSIQANLCRLGCFPDQGFDYALSMFSTLGMIRGRASRRRALAEAGASCGRAAGLALHVHNLWLNLRHPQGRSWLLGQAWRALFDASRLGDRRMNYRGIPGMHVHLYRWGELKA